MTPRQAFDIPSCPGRRFAGCSAVVTGAARGIGRAIALRIGAEGGAVAVVAGSDRAGAEAVAAEIEAGGGRALVHTVDVTDRVQIERLFDEVAAAFGGIDVLINNAGLGRPARLLDLDETAWDDVFRVNAKGVFLASVAVARHMAAQGRGGSIVNIAGASAHRCYPGAGAYGPAKAAVVSLTRQMALEWADLGIRVNGVSPGPIRSIDGWEAREPALAEEVLRLPLKRAGTPEEVAAAVCHLASKEATYTTGQMLVVDGGGVETWYLSLGG